LIEKLSIRFEGSIIFGLLLMLRCFDIAVGGLLAETDVVLDVERVNLCMCPGLALIFVSW
jgi:hypothetical protein